MGNIEENRIAEAFDQLDDDNSGFISFEVRDERLPKIIAKSCTRQTSCCETSYILRWKLTLITLPFSKNLRKVLGRHYTKKKVDQLISEADADCDGHISYKEFMQIMSHKRKMEEIQSIGSSPRSVEEQNISEEDLLDEHAIIPGGKFQQKERNEVKTHTD